ncbi:MAG: hypothetical protein EXX96DRAFT_592416 [Benjaminiella poitrasii]|nr:MAG: hypothetical protein EXX96DRAFT_592416 [Benjaminiella poitrasii]
MTTTTISGLSKNSLTHSSTEPIVDPHLETTQPKRDDSLGKDVRTAIDVIEKAYNTYGSVLSHLKLNVDLLRTVFVTYPNPFPHVDAFVKVSIQRYGLDCVYIPGPMKKALQQYIDGSSKPTKAIFVGIRRTDPYAENLSHFDQTDKGWPEFMRIHPPAQGYRHACRLENELHERDGRVGTSKK